MNWYNVYYNEIDLRTENVNFLSPIDAAEYTVKNVIKNYNPPYYLMISGGVDSQAMLYSWTSFGKNFIPVAYSYNKIFNIHDLSNIENFATKFNIDVTINDFDLLNFLHTEYPDYSKKYHCSSPCISAYIKMSENLDGTVIFSGDPIIGNGPGLSYAQLGLYRASIQRENLIPYFFIHTPEITYSFTTKNYLNNLKIRTSIPDEYRKKIFYYHDSEFPVIPQLQKTSGFEKVKDYYDENFWHLVPAINRLKYSHKPSKRTFDLLYRYPYEDESDWNGVKSILNNLGQINS